MQFMMLISVFPNNLESIFWSDLGLAKPLSTKLFKFKCQIILCQQAKSPYLHEKSKAIKQVLCGEAAGGRLNKVWLTFDTCSNQALHRIYGYMCTTNLYYTSFVLAWILRYRHTHVHTQWISLRVPRNLKKNHEITFSVKQLSVLQCGDEIRSRLAFQQ